MHAGPRWTSYRTILDRLEGGPPSRNSRAAGKARQADVLKKLLIPAFYAYLPRCAVTDATAKKYIITVMDARGMPVKLINDNFEVKPEVGDDLACFVSVVPDKKFGISCKIVPTSTQVWDDEDIGEEEWKREEGGLGSAAGADGVGSADGATASRGTGMGGWEQSLEGWKRDANASSSAIPSSTPSHATHATHAVPSTAPSHATHAVPSPTTTSPQDGFDPLFRILGLHSPAARAEARALFRTYGLAANTLLNTFRTAKDFMEWEENPTLSASHGHRKPRPVFVTRRKPGTSSSAGTASSSATATTTTTPVPGSGRAAALHDLWTRWYDMLNVQTHVDELKAHLGLADTDESLHVLQNVLLVNPVLSRRILDLIKTDPFTLHDILPRSYPLPVCADLASRVGMDAAHPYHVVRKISALLRDEEDFGNCFATYEFVLSYHRGPARDTALRLLNGEWSPPEDYPGPLTIVVPTRISKSQDQASEADVTTPTLPRIIGDVRESFHVDRTGREARIYRRATWRAQAAYLHWLRETMARPPEAVEEDLVAGLLATFEEGEGLTLTPEQRSVVLAAARHPLVAVIGDAGAGKTTTLKAVLQVLRGLRLREKDMGDVGKNLICLAPTGKAARVFAAKTGWPASTIDSFLCRVGAGLGLESDVLATLSPILVIDEMSMVTLRHTKCIHALAELVAQHRGSGVNPTSPGLIDRVVFVGDGSQLAPIGPGDVFHDTIQIIREATAAALATSSSVPNPTPSSSASTTPSSSVASLGAAVIRLAGCQRVDDAASAIYTNARLIRSDRCRRGVEDAERTDPFERRTLGDFKQVADVFDIEEVSGTPQVKERVLRFAREALAADKADPFQRRRRGYTPLSAMQLMTDTNAKRHEINAWVQDLVQAECHSDASVRLGPDERAFLYDKVMVCDNAQQFGVVNGDIGWVMDMPRADALQLRLEDGRTVQLKTDAVRLTLAYCITVHKSQGSEFPFVVCALFRKHRHTTRTLLYTALSRGQKRVKVLSLPMVFTQCVNTRDQERGSDAFRLFFREGTVPVGTEPAGTASTASTASMGMGSEDGEGDEAEGGV